MTQGETLLMSAFLSHRKSGIDIEDAKTCGFSWGAHSFDAEPRTITSRWVVARVLSSLSRNARADWLETHYLC